MSIQQRVIRLLANTVFFLKRKEINRSSPKFLVFTGTLGKTTLRDTAAFCLNQGGFRVRSNTLGYSNELGVLLAVLDLENFSPKNIYAWLKLLQKKISPNEFVCIELGADFYSDIPWFLKKFLPHAVFICSIANESWSRNLEEIFEERKNLLESVPSDGFIVYNLDDTPTEKLIHKSNIRGQLVSFSLYNSRAAVYLENWTKNIFTKSITEMAKFDETIGIRIGNQHLQVHFRQPLFEPQIYAMAAALGFMQHLVPLDKHNLMNKIGDYHFSKDRLQISKAKNGAIIIEDSYKATPFCMEWFLNMAKKIQAKKKVLVSTEMRPLTINKWHFYSLFLKEIRFANQTYFLGSRNDFEILSKENKSIIYAHEKDYGRIAKEILQTTSLGDLILLKGSFRYQLGKLKNLLL